MRYLICLLLLVSSISRGLAQNKKCKTCNFCQLKYENNSFIGYCRGKKIRFMLMLVDSKAQSPIPKEKLISVAEAGKLVGHMKIKRFNLSLFPISTTQVRDEKTLNLKTEMGWFPTQDLRLENDELSFFFNWQYFPEANIADLNILVRAHKLLNDPQAWNQVDDRKCEDDTENRKRSLFCALQEASIKIEGAYNHRSGAMQTVRESIKLRHPRKRFKHGIRDFNNWKKTNHDDLLEVLTMSIQRMETRLQSHAN